MVKAYKAGNESTSQIGAEYNIAKSTVIQWVNKYKEECLYTKSKTLESNEAKEIRRLNHLLNEKDKEISFLKKQQHSSRRKSNSGISIYSSEQKYFWFKVVM